MLSPEQLSAIVKENEQLGAELQAVNEILTWRDEEIAMLKMQIAAAAEQQSDLELNLADLQHVQSGMAKKQQELEGGRGREQELEQELVEAVQYGLQYNELLEKHEHLEARLADLQDALEASDSRTRQLQNTLSGMAELESRLAIVSMERDALKAKIQSLENDKANTSFVI